MTATAATKHGRTGTTASAPTASKPLRVLHGPFNIGNQAWSLSRAERALGLASDVAVLYETGFRYPADRVLGAPGQRLANATRRLAFGLTAPFHYDVLHYYFGRSFTYVDDLSRRLAEHGEQLLLDLRLARRLGRRIVLTLQGCDARQAGEANARDAHTMCRDGACQLFARCITHTDSERRRYLAAFKAHADCILYLNPDLGHVVPDGAFVPYANVAVAETRLAPPRASVPVRIVHAPSDGSIKGTPLILEAIRRLQSSYDIELMLVQGKSHAEALRLYADADLAIDQVLAGWYGGFAVEMMAMGKPVACYLREADLHVVPEPMRRELPLLRIAPDALADDLARILDHRRHLPEHGARARAFVERWHDPRRIAAALLPIYRGEHRALDWSAFEA